jgi:hypothetical protein
MFHQAIESIEPLGAVVHGVEAPKPRPSMARVMCHRDSEIENPDCENDLQPERPILRPCTLEERQNSEPGQE